MSLYNLKKSTWLPNVFLLLGSLAVAVAFGEGYFRLFDPQVFPPESEDMYTDDPDIGYVLTPGFSGHLDQQEFRMRFTTGNNGLRGRDPGPRLPNTFRILCLGDSITWGWGAEDDGSWPAQLQGRLKDRYPELDVQVLNGGVPGYGTDEELEFLKKRGTDLDPDLVVTMFYPGNDFQDNRTSARESTEMRDGMLYTVEQGEDQYRPAWVKVNTWMKNHGHLVSFVSEHLGYVVMRMGLINMLEPNLAEDISPEDERRAVDLLETISRVSGEMGSSSLIVYIPEKMQVISGEKKVFPAEEVVNRAAVKGKVPWINLAPDILRTEDRLDLYLHRDNHLSPAGYRFVAQVIADRISELGLIFLSQNDAR